MRIFLGLLAGIVVAIVLQSAGDAVSSLVYPPNITNMLSRTQIADALALRPAPALAITAIGYLLGGFGGAAAGKMISSSRAVVWTPALFLSAMSALVGWAYAVPGWALIANVACALVGAMIANHLVGGRQAAASLDDGTADAGV